MALQGRDGAVQVVMMHASAAYWACEIQFCRPVRDLGMNVLLEALQIPWLLDLGCCGTTPHLGFEYALDVVKSGRGRRQENAGGLKGHV